MIERQLLWYMYSEMKDPEKHHWNILAIGERREFEIIKQKLYEQLTPIVPGEGVSFHRVLDEKVIDTGKTRDSKLHYWLFSLETTAGYIDFSKVYEGKVRKDRILCQRRHRKDGMIS